MPKVIKINGYRNETVFDARDFEYLIEKHMGYECAKHYHEQVTELSNLIRELTQYIDDELIHQEVEEVLKVNGY